MEDFLFFANMPLNAFLHWYRFLDHAICFGLFIFCHKYSFYWFLYVDVFQDMNQATPTQELVAKDLHGYEWRFKHIFRGNKNTWFIVLLIQSFDISASMVLVDVRYFKPLCFCCPFYVKVTSTINGQISLMIYLYMINWTGQPRRHLLTTGWSTFVTSKRLVAGDSFVFLR